MARDHTEGASGRTSGVPRTLDGFTFEHDVPLLVDQLSARVLEQARLVRELCTARDQLAARELELVSARAKAEQATETLSTFLHALGHDLRAPLVSIDANLRLLEVLGTTDAAAEVAACTSDMRRTCDHGLALITDLFELIRSDAGQWRVLRAPVSVAEIVRGACALAASHAHSNGLRIETQWHSDAREVIDTDGTRVRQALTNLLINASKFGERGVIRIEIARNTSDELEISVSDQGKGIPEALLPTIFEPFTRDEARGERMGVGAGLGLAIVQRCARLLGGDVTARNGSVLAADCADAGGTCVNGAIFTLRFPAPICGCVVELDHRDAATANATARAKPLVGLRVLVVDDAPDAARLLGHHLRLLGAESAVAESLAHARERLATQRFDLVISDLNLPDGLGLELRLHSHLPICISSSTPRDEVPSPARVGFLAKPVTAAAILEAVGAALARNLT